MSQRTAGQIWGAPTVLAVTSLIGLISALLADGFWDAVSWLGLGAPLVVAAWHVFCSSYWRGKASKSR